mgnify:CR=1 FL=1
MCQEFGLVNSTIQTLWKNKNYASEDNESKLWCRWSYAHVDYTVKNDTVFINDPLCHGWCWAICKKVKRLRIHM